MSALNSMVFGVAIAVLAISVSPATIAVVLDDDQVTMVEAQPETPTQENRAEGTTASDVTAPVETAKTEVAPLADSVATKSPTWAETINIIKNGKTLKTEHWTLIFTGLKSLFLILK